MKCMRFHYGICFTILSAYFIKRACCAHFRIIMFTTLKVYVLIVVDLPLYRSCFVLPFYCSKCVCVCRRHHRSSPSSSFLVRCMLFSVGWCCLLCCVFLYVYLGYCVILSESVVCLIVRLVAFTIRANFVWCRMKQEHMGIKIWIQSHILCTRKQFNHNLNTIILIHHHHYLTCCKMEGMFAN